MCPRNATTRREFQLENHLLKRLALAFCIQCRLKDNRENTQPVFLNGCLFSQTKTAHL